ncbi:unnamed protein product [Effrenium voratum]|nr:unnamed protein product [Effrenium voratum]
MALPPLSLMRSWLPSAPAEPEEVLLHRPCGEVLGELWAALGRAEMEGLGWKLDQALGLVETYLTAARARWKAKDFESEPQDSGEGELNEILQLQRLCSEAPLCEALRRELQQRDTALGDAASAGEKLARAYARAKEMKPWLEELCQSAVPHGKPKPATLQGIGSTRVLQRFSIFPEQEPSLLQCRIDGDPRALLPALAARLADSDSAGILEATVTSCDSGAPGIALQIARRSEDGLQLGEVLLASESLVTVPKSAVCPFLRELEERPEAVEAFGLCPALRLGALVAWVEAPGYHPTAPHRQVLGRTLQDLRRGGFELALLRAPTVQLRIRAPHWDLPLPEVKLETEEMQMAQTDANGRCSLILRPGKQKLRMRHERLCSSWREQLLETREEVELILPLEVSLWRRRLHDRYWEYWVGCKSPLREDCEPFSGPVRLFGQVRQVQDGHLDLDGAESELGTGPDLFAACCLEPPYARQMITRSSGDLWASLCLGIRADTEETGTEELLVFAQTLCCGQPLRGVEVAMEGDLQFTNSQGCCSLALQPGEQVVTVTHAAVTGGACDYLICSEGCQAELPLLLQPLVRAFLVPGEGEQIFQVLAGDGESVLLPVDAEPFSGLLVGDEGEEYRFVDGKLTSKLHAMRCCPMSALCRARAELPGLLWVPWPQSGAASGCGFGQLTREAQSLARLQPQVEVRHPSGQTLAVPLASCRTVAEAADFLRAELPEVHLALAETPAAASESAPGVPQLPENAVLRFGEPLQLLCRLSVRLRFGQLGVAGVEVRLGHFPPAVTDGQGFCEMFVGHGKQKLRVDHGFEAEQLEVDISDIYAFAAVDVRPQIFVYQVVEEAPKVWLCAKRRQLPAAALPVQGQLMLAPDLQVALDAELRPVDLSDLPSLPDSLALDLSQTGYVWRQKSFKTDWRQLLKGPMHLGDLLPPITAVLHPDGLAFRLAAADGRSVAAVCARLAEELGPEKPLGAFQAGRMLAMDEELQPWSCVDVWFLARTKVSLTTPCCRRGLEGALVRIHSEYADADAEESSPAWASGATDAEGRCHFVVPAEEHLVEVSHDLLGTKEWQVQAGAGSKAVLEACPELGVFVYATKEEELSVWMCAHRRHLPSTARPLVGARLGVGLERLERSAPIESLELVLLPWSNASRGPCPLEGLWLDTSELRAQPGQARLLAFQPSGRKEVCPFVRAGEGPVLLGRLRPALLVQLGEERLLAPFAECQSMEALRSWLADHMGCREEEVGLEVPSQNLKPGMEVLAQRLAALDLQILLPDEATEGPEGLEGLEAEVGEVRGRTDAQGDLRMMLPPGRQTLLLKHPCFGEPKRLEVQVPTQLRFFADLRLWIYATEPEEDEEEEPSSRCCMVWVCASREHIPEGAVGICGRVSGTLNGKKVEKELKESGPTEFLFFAGGHEAPQCSLGSLVLAVRRAGHLWSAGGESPLAARQAELRGSEYQRLLSCPVAMGQLLPAVQVGGVEEVQVTLAEAPTAKALREHLAERMGLEYRQLWLQRDGQQLDEEVLQPGWQLECLEVAPVKVRVVTACCLTPLPDVSIFLSGTSSPTSGSTDAEGVFHGEAPLGACEVRFQHPAFQGGEVCLTVERDRNEALCKAKPRFFIYATDPEPEEEGELDPSCVWLAALQAHVPEEAVPLRGAVRCAWGSDVLGASFVDKGIASFCLEGTDAAQSCPVAGLSLRCSRKDFLWHAKDPSPLLERTDELGGCEALRLSACPVALGFLKPCATVHLAAETLQLPLDAGEEANRAQLEASGEGMLLTTSGEAVPGHIPRCDLLWAAPKDVEAAERQYQKHKADLYIEEGQGQTLPLHIEYVGAVNHASAA